MLSLGKILYLHKNGGGRMVEDALKFSPLGRPMAGQEPAVF